MVNSVVQANKKIILTAVFIFTIAVVFGFGNIKKASAAPTSCQCYMDDPSSPTGLTLDTAIAFFETEQECISYCKNDRKAGNSYKWGGQDRVDSSTRGGPQDLEMGKEVCDGIGIENVFNPKTWFNCFLLALLGFFGWVLSAVATLFAAVVDVNVFNKIVGSNPVIYEIWGMVRDTLNIAFILVLLFSAFCTIFQIEKYNYKKILLNLVIMALLVNFSFPISRVIIDFSNVIMYYFIKNLGLSSETGNLFASIAESSDLKNIVAINNVNANTSFLLAAVVFTFIFLVTILVVTLLLLIRVMVLALLVIFSSIAFVGSIVPFLSEYATKWWSNLFKYSFFGPIMIFMIVVSLKMMSAITSLGGKFGNIAGGQTLSWGKETVAAMAFFSLPIVILWVGMSFAKTMSIAGAGAITGMAEKFLKSAGKSPFKLAWIGAKKVDRDVLAKRGLSVKTFKEAWNQRKKDAEERAYGPATGAWRDRLNYIFSGGKEKTKFKEAALQANVAREQKDVSAYSENVDVLLSELESAKLAKKSDRVAAILRVIWNNNDQNDLLQHHNLDVTPENKKQFLYDTLKNSGMNEDQIMKQMNDIGEVAFTKGNYADYGMVKFDKNTGKFRLAEKRIDKATGEMIDEQAEASIGKSTNLEPQEKMRKWHWNSILEQTVDGKTGGIHDLGKTHLKNMTMLEVNQTNRARKDFINKMYERRKEIEELAKEVESSGKIEDIEQAKVIRAFVAKIAEQKNVKDNEPKKEKSPILDRFEKPYEK